MPWVGDIYWSTREENTEGSHTQPPHEGRICFVQSILCPKEDQRTLRRGIFNLLPVWAPFSTAIIHCCQIDQHVLCKGYCYVARQCLITPPGLNVLEESASRGTLAVSALPQPPGHCPHKPLQHLSNWNCTCYRYNVNLKETLDSKELFCWLKIMQSGEELTSRKIKWTERWPLFLSAVFKLAPCNSKLVIIVAFGKQRQKVFPSPSAAFHSKLIRNLWRIAILNRVAN